MTVATITYTSVNFDTSTPKFGTGAINGGYATIPGGTIAGYPFTLECWVKASAAPSALKVIMGQAHCAYLSMTTAGLVQAVVGSGTVQTLATSASVADGNWHHIAVSVTSTGITGAFLDGVSFGSSTTAPTCSFTVSTGQGQLAVGNYGSSITTGFQFAAVGYEVDEAAVWSTNKYTANFTPPASAYIGTESGLIAVFPFDPVAATAATTPVGVPIGGSYIGGPVSGTLTLTPTTGTAYAVLNLNGADEGTRVQFSGSALPNLVPQSTGNYSVAIYAAATGGVALSASAQFAVSSSTTIVYTTPSFDTSGQKFGASALNGGYGYAPFGVITGYPFTFEAWFKIGQAPSALSVILGQNGLGWAGVTTGGQLEVVIGSVALQNTFTSAGVVTGGNWHHVAVSVTATGVTGVYLDGVSFGSSVVAPSCIFASGTANGHFAVGNYGGSLSYQFAAVGQDVDEVAIWSTNKYLAGFTPPTSAYVGNETGLTVVYHLDLAIITAAATPVGGPTSIYAGALINGFTTTTTPTTAQAYASLSVNGSEEGSRIAFVGSILPVLTPLSTGSYTVGIYAFATGGSALATSAAITVAAAPATIDPSDAYIYYSPYGWLVQSGSAQTINAGQYFRRKFVGTSCTLLFNVAADAAPLPQIWVSIDGQPPVMYVVAAQVPLTMPSTTTAWPFHTIEVVVKSTSEFVSRWSPQSAAVTFTGMQLSAVGAVTVPQIAKGNVLFIGDSITEGYHTVNSNAAGGADTFGSDGALGWAYMQAKLLGAEVGVVGFGGTGLTHAGVGGVPATPSTYNFLWAGQARIFSPPPDLIVINIGTNDSTSDPAVFQAAYVTLLNGLQSYCPLAQIAVMRPFSGAQWSACQAAAALCTNPGFVRLIDTTGFFNTAESVDGIHPLGVANINEIAPQVANALRPILYPNNGGAGLRGGFSF